jgi:rare lipoprotein A (peptidoglycan hydrolase)
MTAGRNRYGRKDHSGHGRATGERLSRRLRWAALVGALASLALGSVPAAAVTGGASATTAEAPPTPGGIVFSSMRTAGATWYGPGLYGNHTACGETLQPGTIGVAHRTLPCGATVKLAYHGHTLITQVIDRGPYTPGNAFDLTNGARKALEFNGSAQLHYAVAVQTARHR